MAKKSSRIVRPVPDPYPLPGFPGYRNQPDRSGLDPLDTNREMAYQEGKFYHHLFTGRLRTSNPIYVGLMLILSIFFTVPIILSFVELRASDHAGSFCLSLPMFLIGIAFLSNFYRNIYESPEN